jgi:hypothetical protein
VGQKNKLTRRWARRGTRPSAPHDQRTAWAYLFGAICPEKGKGAGLVLPYCDTEAMAAQLEEISQAVAPGAHAVLMLDQAGWHLTPKLKVPDNISLLPLPPRSPECRGRSKIRPPGRRGSEAANADHVTSRLVTGAKGRAFRRELRVSG